MTATIATGLLAVAMCMAQPPDMSRSKAAFDKVCGVCHTPDSAVATRLTRAQWQESIDKMIQLGAKGSDEDFAVILDYLASQYGRDSAETAPSAGRGRPRYTPSSTFDTFPFPEGSTPDTPSRKFEADPRAIQIAQAARRLNELRENWLNPPELVRRMPEVVPGFPDRVMPHRR
jgi:hypothetical protein